MLIEILQEFNVAIVAIVASAVNTTKIVLRAFIKAGLIFKNGVATASPIEIFIILVLFAAIGYFICTYVFGSAQQFMKYIIILVALFLLTILIL